MNLIKSRMRLMYLLIFLHTQLSESNKESDEFDVCANFPSYSAFNESNKEPDVLVVFNSSFS